MYYDEDRIPYDQPDEDFPDSHDEPESDPDADIR
jgi:hypothetical protein